jgi:hypothetical protein
LVRVLAVRRVMQLLTPAPIEALLNYFVIRGQTRPWPLEPESPLRLHPSTAAVERQMLPAAHKIKSLFMLKLSSKYL